MSARPAQGVPAFVEPLESRQLLAANGLSAVYFNNRDFNYRNWWSCHWHFHAFS